MAYHTLYKNHFVILIKKYIFAILDSSDGRGKPRKGGIEAPYDIVVLNETGLVAELHVKIPGLVKISHLKNGCNTINL